MEIQLSASLYRHVNNISAEIRQQAISAQLKFY
jgi:hypothetical protein